MKLQEAGMHTDRHTHIGRGYKVEGTIIIHEQSNVHYRILHILEGNKYFFNGLCLLTSIEWSLADQAQLLKWLQRYGITDKERNLLRYIHPLIGSNSFKRQFLDMSNKHK